MKMNENLMREVLMLVPNLAIMIGKLAVDKRVPTETKTMLGAAALYVISPIDAVPDMIPGLGQLDDLVMILFIVDGLVNQIDPDILREHWRGDPAMLERLLGLARSATRFVPSFVRDKAMDRAMGSRSATAMRGVSAFMGGSQRGGGQMGRMDSDAGMGAGMSGGVGSGMNSGMGSGGSGEG